MQSISKKNYNKEGKLKQNNDFDMLIFDDVYDQEMHALGVSKAHKRPSKLTEYYDGLGKHSYIGVQKSKKKDVEKSVKNSSIKKSSVASIAQLDDDDIDGFDVDFFRELDFELDDEDLELRDLFSGDDEYYF